MTGGNETGDAHHDPMIEEEPPKRGVKTVVILVLVFLALVVTVLLLVDAFGDDDEADLVSTESTVPASSSVAPSSTTPATTAPPTTAPATTTPATTAPPATTQPATTAPVVTVPIPAVTEAVWPFADSDVRYTDPVEAARGFAVDYVGFTDPIVGEFQAGDNRSGEVEVRSFENGPATVVLVRQITDDDTWWVLGSATENIVVEQPEALSTVTSPLTVSGEARAFEGTVDVELRGDGLDEPLASGFVTGSGGPDLGPFEGTFEFDQPDVFAGALVLFTLSAEDGSVVEASVMRVLFDAAV